MKPKVAAQITNVYILAKNEEENIGKCLSCLSQCEVQVTLLDSGSIDKTKDIAHQFQYCEVRDFAFTNHTDAWNLITGTWHQQGEFVLILDADMEVSMSLWNELNEVIRHDPDVVLAPVVMYVDGIPLRFGSLYPPKAILFRGGGQYFLPKGHCSKLRPQLRTLLTKSRLVHNDLKPYTSYLSSQVRYGTLLYDRFKTGAVSWRDWLRATSPVMAIAYPVVSLFMRGGIFAGRLGLMYALDRAIAALIQYRTVLKCQERDNMLQCSSTGDKYTPHGAA